MGVGVFARLQHTPGIRQWDPRAENWVLDPWSIWDQNPRLGPALPEIAIQLPKLTKSSKPTSSIARSACGFYGSHRTWPCISPPASFGFRRCFEGSRSSTAHVLAHVSFAVVSCLAPYEFLCYEFLCYEFLCREFLQAPPCIACH